MVTDHRSMIPWLRFKPASVLNLCSTIEGNNALVVEGVLQELLGIVLPILDELVVPGHPVGPEAQGRGWTQLPREQGLSHSW